MLFIKKRHLRHARHERHMLFIKKDTPDTKITFYFSCLEVSFVRHEPVSDVSWCRGVEKLHSSEEILFKSEPIPVEFSKLLSKNRKIFAINACIANKKPVVAKVDAQDIYVVKN